MNPWTLFGALRARLGAAHSAVAARERRLRSSLATAVACLFALATVGLSLPTPVVSHPARAARFADLRLTRIAAGSNSRLERASSPRPGRDGAEAAARRLVRQVGGLSIGPPGRRLVDPVGALVTSCPSYRLVVSWTAPQGHYTVGGYLSPVGPAPTAETTEVNGVVLCRDSDYAYLGFEAIWDGSQWSVIPVPAGGDDSANNLAPAADAVAAPSPAQPTGLSVGPTPAVTGDWGPAIEPLAPYQPQTTCDPTPKAGVVGLKNLLLSSFPGSTDLGIGQACDAPDGVSEHKEGRAFDWGVNIANPAQRAMAEQLLAWLFAPDQYGNQYAMIRRLGIMYIIWDRHIWGAYAADQGWRDYAGVSPHTDHIHFSFDWAGALGQTSFWTGHVGAVVPVGPVSGAVPPYVAPPVGGIAAPTPGTSVPDPQAQPAAPAGGSPQAAPESENDPGGQSGSTTSTTPSSTTTTTTTPAPSQPPPPPTTPPPPSTLLPPLPTGP